MADTILERRPCQAGESIFKEGEQGDRAYVVQAGEVEIVKEIDGQSVVLGTIGPGGIFGEMALIDDKPRMAAARMSKGGTVIVVSRQTFEDKMSKTDPFIRGMLNVFANTIRSMSERTKA